MISSAHTCRPRASEVEASSNRDIHQQPKSPHLTALSSSSSIILVSPGHGHERTAGRSRFTRIASQSSRSRSTVYYAKHCVSAIPYVSHRREQGARHARELHFGIQPPCTSAPHRGPSYNYSYIPSTFQTIHTDDYRCCDRHAHGDARHLHRVVHPRRDASATHVAVAVFVVSRSPRLFQLRPASNWPRRTRFVCVS